MNLSKASIPTVEAQPSSVHRAVAPAWHTVVVLAVELGFSLVGALRPNLSPLGRSHGRAGGYIFVILYEWLTVAFIWYGLRLRGFTMSNLVGGRWQRPGAIMRDIGIGLAFLLVIGVGLLNVLGYLMKAAPTQAMRNMLPESPMELMLWILMSLTAGFCEEVIFRGYLNRQFAALTRTATGGIVLQAVAFGLGHGYQGWKLMLLISVYGVMFGLLVFWRRSLRPGMITHAVQDSLGGIIGRHFLR